MSSSEEWQSMSSQQGPQEDSDIHYFIYYYAHSPFQVNLSLSQEGQENNNHEDDEDEKDQSQFLEQEEEGELSHMTYSHVSEESSEESSSGSVQSDESQEGMSSEDITKLPSMIWTDSYQANNNCEQCAICITPFRVGQRLRVLNCLHRFHTKCVDKWLTGSRTCPTCRSFVQALK